MRKDLTTQLYLRFPNIFKGLNKPLTDSLMVFGFECGDGWYDLIYQLCEEIEKQSLLEDVCVPEAIQVKEKFGELRFYVSGTTSSILDVIEDAADKSEKICEICGQPGITLENRGWLKTRCEKHKNE